MPDIYRILLIEDNPGDARLLKELLVQSGTTAFTLEWADRLSTGLERLRQGGIDAVLLDLTLPDSRGFDTFLRARGQFPSLPIILMTGLDDEDLAVRAVREGAQDYMVKGQVSGPSLVRAMRYAIERQRQASRVEAPEPIRRKARMIGFVGTKGGVGTTTAVLNIASLLAQRDAAIAVELRSNHGSFAHQTLLAPALNLSSLLTMDPGAITEADLQPRLFKWRSALQLMYGPQCAEEFREITPAHVSAILTRLGGMCDYLLVDIANDASETMRAALRECGFVVVVVEPEPVSLASAKITLETLAAWGIGSANTAVLFNNRVSFMNAYRFNEIRTQMGCGVLGMVPPAPDAFMVANTAGVPLALSKPDSNAGSMLGEISRRLAADPVDVLK